VHDAALSALQVPQINIYISCGNLKLQVESMIMRLTATGIKDASDS
jgi:hypothetical protein